MTTRNISLNAFALNARQRRFGSTGTYGLLDVFGPTVEFLTSPEETEASYCIMIGTVPRVSPFLFTAILIPRVSICSPELLRLCLNGDMISNG